MPFARRAQPLFASADIASTQSNAQIWQCYHLVHVHDHNCIALRLPYLHPSSAKVHAPVVANLTWFLFPFFVTAIAEVRRAETKEGCNLSHILRVCKHGSHSRSNTNGICTLYSHCHVQGIQKAHDRVIFHYMTHKPGIH